MSIRLIGGDCREVLATLPDDSVHCVVTSPPYYGLRDYGTAQWAGGDAACGHLMPANGVRDKGRDRAASGGTFHDSPTPNQIPMQFRDTCGKCGATRVDRQIGLEATPDCGKRGLFRLRADLTEAQREFVVRRLVSGARRDV
jgi:hypothetical protein